jgi:SAM-dependent methyltransferase
MRPGGTVLDLGCGSGRDLAALREAGFAPTGLDISPRLAAMAEEHSGCPVLVGDMRNPPLENVTFDGIWAAASLLHLHRSEIPAVLDRMRRLLAPGGRLFASVKAGSGEERTQDGRWFTYFHPQEWRDLLAASGFTEIEIGHDIGEAGRTRSNEGWIQSFASAP